MGIYRACAQTLRPRMFRLCRASLAIPFATIGLAVCHANASHSIRCDYSPMNAVGVPKNIRIKDTPFCLIASGTRKVTFLSISVYDIGIYIASEDVVKLNSALKDLHIDNRDELIAYLKDPTSGPAFFNALKDMSFALRIQPVRNTDIAHMRDGFVRGILLRQDPGESLLNSFKEFFPNPRKAFLKGDTMLLTLWHSQALDLDINGHDYGSFTARGAEVGDLLRAFLATYTSGKKVASEPLRQEFIEQLAIEAQ